MTDYATLSTRDIERLSRNIKPGEWAVEGERPISTLLGSCVAVCLYDAALRLAGMNHFMLPQMKKGTHADEDVLLAGDACMEALLNAMLQRGAAKHRMRAKAFGGGAVIDATAPGMLAVGKRNADFAHEWLEREGIPIVASDFLGPWSRKILLVPATGDAYCKRVTSGLISQESLRREELAYAESLLNKPATVANKKIELF
ncbi:chemotaxis protein CheD [Azonexus hydrophilus]|jgi:chemotaxis protein CheD|uniref:Probable chemoreceptor glutamine deamidase CheD n=1 Tax=Azonexus hydrophilus TaxID=418702 RepID=A0A1R1I2J1_9RHOO|nr:chemotaxis protein CheD [Azonexus hydrophilus]OMG52988.1 chemotaxis protein CheD [Azonexus hydrophilus]